MINIEIERCTPEEQTKLIKRVISYEKKAQDTGIVTVPKMLEEVANSFCDNYCKWPEKWDAEKEGCELFDSWVCAICPVNKLI